MADKKTSKAEEQKKVSKKAEKKKSNKKNPFKSMSKFFKGVNAERKKVVWPTAKETLKNTVIVLVVVVIVGVAIYGVDTLLSLGMKGIKNLAETTTASTTVSDTTNESGTSASEATTAAAE
ncbi:MAG: preprotein translocase subunit SecE [Clostridiales bacterium]|nr:preprotein translocase subunit SecE [Clostridiales bacterium]